MTRANSLALLVLIIAGLNMGIDGVFDYNAVADVLNDKLYDVFGVVVGISGLVALSDRMGWTHD